MGVGFLKFIFDALFWVNRAHISRVLGFIFVLSRVFKVSLVYPVFVKSARYIPCLSHQAKCAVVDGHVGVESTSDATSSRELLLPTVNQYS